MRDALGPAGPSVALTERMSSRAQWIVARVGIGAAALALAVVFFIATQTITVQDMIVTAIGAVLGTLAGAFISTWGFHRERRKDTQRAERDAASITATAEVERLNAVAADERNAAAAKADAEAAAIRIRAQADAIRTRADADAPPVAKRADLLTALPTRRDRLTELHQEITLTQQNINIAEANADASTFNARDVLNHGVREITHEREAEAKNWWLKADEFARRLPELRAERDRVQAMPDDFLSDQTRTRGIA